MQTESAGASDRKVRTSPLSRGHTFRIIRCKNKKLEHFPAKRPPVCVAKMRPNKEIEPRSDSIGTEKALERGSAFSGAPGALALRHTMQDRRTTRADIFTRGPRLFPVVARNRRHGKAAARPANTPLVLRCEERPGARGAVRVISAVGIRIIGDSRAGDLLGLGRGGSIGGRGCRGGSASLSRLPSGSTHGRSCRRGSAGLNSLVGGLSHRGGSACEEESYAKNGTDD